MNLKQIDLRLAGPEAKFFCGPRMCRACDWPACRSFPTIFLFSPLKITKTGFEMLSCSRIKDLIDNIYACVCI